MSNHKPGWTFRSDPFTRTGPKYGQTKSGWTYEQGKTCDECGIAMRDQRCWVRCDDCYPMDARVEDTERGWAGKYWDPDAGNIPAPRRKSRPTAVPEPKTETTGGNMKRPAWAGSPAFTEAWSTLERVKARTTDERVAGNAAAMLRCLAKANVVVISPEQADALPSSTNLDGDGSLADVLDILAARMRGTMLPFPFTFIDADGAALKGKIEEGDENVRFAGAMLMDSDHLPDGGVGGFAPNEGAGIEGIVGFTFYRLTNPDRMSCSPTGLAFAPLGAAAGKQSIPYCTDFFGLGENHIRLIQASIGPMDVALTLLEFLQSVNVDLVEDGLDRQQMKRANRKGQRIPLTVRVQAPKRRSPKPGGDARSFSHRFEVAGHYTHNFETKADGTPNLTFARCAKKQPEKVLTIGGQRCVRWWTPPHVKGPEGAPLIPKLRVVSPALDNVRPTS